MILPGILPHEGVHRHLMAIRLYEGDAHGAAVEYFGIVDHLPGDQGTIITKAHIVTFLSSRLGCIDKFFKTLQRVNDCLIALGTKQLFRPARVIL